MLVGIHVRHQKMTIGQAGIRARKGRIDVERPLKVVHRAPIVFARPLVPVISAPHVLRMGARIHGRGAGETSFEVERAPDTARDRPGGFAFEHEALGRRTIEAFGPHLAPIPNADQAGRHQHPIVPALQIPVDDVLHAHFAGDPIHRRPRALVVHRRRARHDAQTLGIQLAQLRDGLFRQPIDRGILVWIAALILERQHEQQLGRGGRLCLS